MLIAEIRDCKNETAKETTATYKHINNDSLSHVFKNAITAVIADTTNVAQHQSIIHSKNLARAGLFCDIFAKNGIFIGVTV